MSLIMTDPAEAAAAAAAASAVAEEASRAALMHAFWSPFHTI